MVLTEETTVNDRGSVAIPAGVRDEIDIEPGDKIRWSVTEDGSVEVSIIRERRGFLSDAEPIDVGEETDSVELGEETAYEISFDDDFDEFDRVTRLNTDTDPFS